MVSKYLRTPQGAVAMVQFTRAYSLEFIYKKIQQSKTETDIAVNILLSFRITLIFFVNYLR
jgi:hypothetical protein